MRKSHGDQRETKEGKRGLKWSGQNKQIQYGAGQYCRKWRYEKRAFGPSTLPREAIQKQNRTLFSFHL